MTARNHDRSSPFSFRRDPNRPLSIPSSPVLTPMTSTASYASPWSHSSSAGASSTLLQGEPLSAPPLVNGSASASSSVPSSQTAARKLLVPVMHPPRHHSSFSLPDPSELIPPAHRRGDSRKRSTNASHSKMKSVSDLSGPSSRASSASDQSKGDSQDKNGSQGFAESLRKFEVVQENVELEGYRIYAVEKWVVERTRYITVLTAYTGDPRDKIIVTVYAQTKSISVSQAKAEWDSALYHFKRDGARAKETPQGTIMLTSLEKFRSDYTTVPIPSGNFLDVREGLYANINLLRMGCSGRSALTLEEPSDTTKDRFIATFNLSENCRSRDLFCNTVLEVVRLIQAALAVFGMFSLSTIERDGLLCDVTIEGLQKWVQEVGEEFLDLEPMERLGDPVTISSLLSLIIVVRNKLYAVGVSQNSSKDPFIDPVGFMRALHGFLIESSSKLPLSTVQFLSNGPHKLAVLTPQYLELIDSLHEKARSNDSYKVHRVILSKLDDITTDLRTHAGAPGGGVSAAAVNANMTVATNDLHAFVKAMRGRDGAASVRYLWAGRLEQLRERRDNVQSDGEERERGDKDKASEEENDWINNMHWSGKIKRVNAWASLRRPQKPSLDLSLRSRPALLEEETSRTPEARTARQIPSVVLSPDHDEDEILSSGQVSPISPNRSLLALGNFPEPSTPNLLGAERKLPEHILKGLAGTRITSWADPLSARGFLKPGDDSDATDDLNLGGGRSSRHSLSSIDEGEAYLSIRDDISVLGDLKARVPSTRRRSYSFTDAAEYSNLRLQKREDLEIDVDLCAQLVVMWRRERHFKLVLKTLRALSTAIEVSNTSLLEDYHAHQSYLEEMKKRAKIISEIAMLYHETNQLAQDAAAIQYEAETYNPVDMWHTVRPARQSIINLREKVFGTGRRFQTGAHGAHGRFDRLQWTLDGDERLVDWMGRTESEAEEEDELGSIKSYEDEPVEDVVENPSMRPTWVLRFFNSWLSRWGPPSSTTKNEDGKADNTVEAPLPSISSGSLQPSVASSSDGGSRSSSRQTELPAQRLDDDANGIEPMD